MGLGAEGRGGLPRGRSGWAAGQGLCGSGRGRGLAGHTHPGSGISGSQMLGQRLSPAPGSPTLPSLRPNPSTSPRTPRPGTPRLSAARPRPAVGRPAQPACQPPGGGHRGGGWVGGREPWPRPAAASLAPASSLLLGHRGTILEGVTLAAPPHHSLTSGTPALSQEGEGRAARGRGTGLRVQPSC